VHQACDDIVELSDLESTNQRLLGNLLPRHLLARLSGGQNSCTQPLSPSQSSAGGTTLQDIYRQAGTLPPSEVVVGTGHQTAAVAFISVDNLEVCVVHFQAFLIRTK